MSILQRAYDLEWERVREQGNELIEGKQAPRKAWCVKALKGEISEEEWLAGCRAVRDCAAAFDGMSRQFDDIPVDGGSTDYGLAAKVSAVRALEGLRQAAWTRTNATLAARCVEWIVQLHTLPEIAVGMGVWRKMGPGREPIPDTRPAKPFTRLVLMAMAGYYYDCDRGLERHNARR